ncbi:hypothetical protein QJS10_CPB21g01539 [Acorus calamus]|uniref:Uncharacterized protein n=1 Tax=Acorus calamus TaxID=4465 RepID=A0AAV9C685_ACOCL|nr:hypothetical protein QJS10_CPB21g01539 [Acorus calamus]
MEKHKWRMVRRLLSWRRDEDALRECLHKVKALEERARSCYSEAIDMGSNEFVEMMVLDGCFIIGLLLLPWSEDAWVVWEGQKDEEELHNSSYTSVLVGHDLLKVENQMPFFVVEALFDLLVLQSDNGPSDSIYDLALTLLDRWNPSNDFNYVKKTPKVHHHLLHIFHDLLAQNENSTVQCNLIIDGFLKIKNKIEDLLLQVHNALPSFLRRSKASEGRKKKWTLGWIKCATELQESGVKFVEKRSCSFLNVTFEDGVLEFPVLCIFDETVIHFRNLIAFEQLYPNAGNHITFYAVLMDFLIDTRRDVNVLHREGVLQIGLSSEKDVAQFFNSLCKEVIYDSSQNKLFIDLNRYCNSKWHRWRTVLARDYFGSPWAAISVLAAFVLLLLTLLQTVYTMYSYYHS